MKHNTAGQEQKHKQTESKPDRNQVSMQQPAWAASATIERNIAAWFVTSLLYFVGGTGVETGISRLFNHEGAQRPLMCTENRHKREQTDRTAKTHTSTVDTQHTYCRHPTHIL